jgi:hypothetical protein
MASRLSPRAVAWHSPRGNSIRKGLAKAEFGEHLFVIPQAMQETVLTHAEEITAQENAIRAGIRLGLRMDELRRQHGYHDLQSPGYVEVETKAD